MSGLVRCAALALLLPAIALAQRPEEAEMFGAPAEAPDAGAAPVERGSPPDGGTVAEKVAETRDERELQAGPITDAFAAGTAAEDPLTIGGRFYFQVIGSGGLRQKIVNSKVSAPTLIDGYFDARPNDRIRGMVVARMNYDASLPAQATTTTLVVNPDGSVRPVTATISNPRVFLDQANLRFDIERVVFVTAGKQHVKWGASRIWNPTDYLTPQVRDPLAFVDVRLGASMLKLHVPWEKYGANFYAIGLIDNLGNADTFGKLGGALRAEAVVLSTAEVGLGAVFQYGEQPRYAVDFSTPLGPIDIYGEAALKKGSTTPLVRCATPDDPCPFISIASYQLYTPTGWTPAVSGGLEWTFKYAENETATIGAEYLYNYNGTDDVSLYPAQLLTGTFVPFYTGTHYAALYAALIGPGSWDKVAFNLFNLVNLSDLSAVSRLNFSVSALTYLTIDAFAAIHFGNPKGEFRLGIDTPELTLPGLPSAPPIVIPALSIPPALWELGVGLRVNI